jgi:NAD(P)-dependent dehydrogenase (short-subunit alcohol dehydrogenase family)
MSQHLQHKRIIITGGTSGIGRAAAIQAAQAGADIAFCGLTEEGATQTIAEIEKVGRRPFFRALDLGNLEEARRFTQDSIEFLGGVDGVVNNAGANFWHSVAGATYEGIQRCFHVNFYSAWAVSQEAYPALKAAGGGVVVNVASIHAERTLPGVFPYNVAKAAVAAMTKSMALEWGADNIQAIAIAPGMVMTAMVQEYLSQFEDPVQELKRLESHYPLQRAGRPEEVASLIVYLLSGANRFISGQTILVDGAISALMESPDQ